MTPTTRMNTKLLLDALAAFGKAFAMVALAVAVGLLSLPNLDGALALGLAGLCAALAAGFAAVQVFVPAISVRAYLPEPWGSAIDSAIHAGLATFLTLVTGWLSAPDFGAWRAFLGGLVVAVGNAILRALQGRFFGDVAQPPIGRTRRRRTAAQHATAAHATPALPLA